MIYYPSYVLKDKVMLVVVYFGSLLHKNYPVEVYDVCNQIAVSDPLQLPLMTFVKGVKHKNQTIVVYEDIFRHKDI